MNGCFDQLHPGHILLLQTAANHCDILWIAVNSDDYCRRKKGPTRPTQSQIDRLSAIGKATQRLPCRVNLIRLEEDTPARLLSRIQPDIYVLGSDYRDQPLPGAKHCGRILFVERLPGISTTRLIEQM